MTLLVDRHNSRLRCIGLAALLTLTPLLANADNLLRQRLEAAQPQQPLRIDGITVQIRADLLDFYRQLPNGDRQFVILPQTAHSAGYSSNRHLLWYAMKNFLAAPATIA